LSHKRVHARLSTRYGEIREPTEQPAPSFPDFASLNPGYKLF